MSQLSPEMLIIESLTAENLPDFFRLVKGVFPEMTKSESSDPSFRMILSSGLPFSVIAYLPSELALPPVTPSEAASVSENSSARVPVGCVGIRVEDDCNGITLNAAYLAVLPQYRRLGFATRLSNEAKSRIVAFRPRVTEVVLLVRMNNVPAMTMYKKLGFVVVGPDVTGTSYVMRRPVTDEDRQ